MDEALRISQDRAGAIFGSSPLGVALAQLDGRIVLANKTYQDMLGYTGAELEGLNFRDLTYEADLPYHSILFQELVEAKRTSFIIEERYRRKGGTLLWVRSNVWLVGRANAKPGLPSPWSRTSARGGGWTRR